MYTKYKLYPLILIVVLSLIFIATIGLNNTICLWYIGLIVYASLWLTELIISIVRGVQ